MLFRFSLMSVEPDFTSPRRHQISALTQECGTRNEDLKDILEGFRTSRNARERGEHNGYSYPGIGVRKSRACFAFRCLSRVCRSNIAMNAYSSSHLSQCLDIPENKFCFLRVLSKFLYSKTRNDSIMS